MEGEILSTQIKTEKNIPIEVEGAIISGVRPFLDLIDEAERREERLQQNGEENGLELNEALVGNAIYQYLNYPLH